MLAECTIEQIMVGLALKAYIVSTIFTAGIYIFTDGADIISQSSIIAIAFGAVGCRLRAMHAWTRAGSCYECV